MRTFAIWVFGIGIITLVLVLALIQHSPLRTPTTSSSNDATTTANQAASSTDAVITNSTFHFSIPDPQASLHIANIEDAYIVHPSWIAIFDAQDGTPVGQPLGVVFIEPADGPQHATLLLTRQLIAKHPYAAVLYEDDGDMRFNPADEFAIIRPDGEKAILLFTAKP